MTPPPALTEQPLLLTAAQAGQLLGVSEWTFNKMVRDGLIPDNVEWPATCGQRRNRRFIRRRLEAFVNGDLDP